MVFYLCIGQNLKNQPNLVLYLVQRSKIFESVATLAFGMRSSIYLWNCTTLWVAAWGMAHHVFVPCGLQRWNGQVCSAWRGRGLACERQTADRHQTDREEERGTQRRLIHTGMEWFILFAICKRNLLWINLARVPCKAVPRGLDVVKCLYSQQGPFWEQKTTPVADCHCNRCSL